jgi:hypothetical protein
MTTATTPNMEHLLHPALKNKNKMPHNPFWNLIPHWKIPGHVTLEIEQVRAGTGQRRNISPTLGSGTAMLLYGRERNRYGGFSCCSVLSELSVSAREMDFACLFGEASDRILFAAEDVYLRCVRP